MGRTRQSKHEESRQIRMLVWTLVGGERQGFLDVVKQTVDQG